MSSRHRERKRERRSRSRSPYGEQQNLKKQGRQTRYERNREENNSSNNDHGRRLKGRRDKDRRTKNGEGRGTNSSPEKERRRQSINLENAGRSNSQSKEEPNFELSGKLTEYTNTYKGVVIKYNEPPEAIKPKTRWRLYPFKGDDAMPVMYIHRQSAYLIGRQRHIVDLAVDHPSCSKQHAVLQYRLVGYEREDGTAGRKCKPYIIDLESVNGTFLNNQKIEARRYYELKEKDVLKFGFSSREYVLLNEKSKKSEVDEDEDISDEANS